MIAIPLSLLLIAEMMLMVVVDASYVVANNVSHASTCHKLCGENGSTFCPIHPRESSVSRGNSCGGIRNSRFVEVRLSTRYGTMISNQRTSTLVHADTHAGLSFTLVSRSVRSFLIVRFARGLRTLVKSRSLKRGIATSGTESCSLARSLVHSRNNNVYMQRDSSCLELLAILAAGMAMAADSRIGRIALADAARGGGVLSTIPLSSSVFPAIGIRRVFAVAGLQTSRPQISDFNFIPTIRSRRGLYRRFNPAMAWGCKYVRDKQSELQA
ncbi:hypothetical protein ALC57_17988 [Trachymyrmex cornetzi]|uniref:Secreted protein n=1 Tax=Trachymyrmex cornetzi TaxID=471704 RepID=A0A151ISJ7_9HYME|nr:hypothetical protein ALC57_17988 [Trachymyrmex cornetzi]